MGQLAGKVAVVTGASTERGIGSAIATRFAQEGAAVFLVAEGAVEQLEKVRNECRNYPGAGLIEYGVFDLSERGAAERMIEEAARRLKTYVPLGRLGEPAEIADVALFLATTNATYLQGEDICVDGGYTSH